MPNWFQRQQDAIRNRDRYLLPSFLSSGATLNREERIEGLIQNFLDRFVEDPMEGSPFDCDVLEVLNKLKEKYKRPDYLFLNVDGALVRKESHLDGSASFDRWNGDRWVRFLDPIGALHEGIPLSEKDAFILMAGLSPLGREMKNRLYDSSTA